MVCRLELAWWRPRLGLFSLLAVKLGHARDELINEDMHVVLCVLHTGENIVVAKEGGNRDGETGNGREQRGGDARRDGIHIHLTSLCHGGEGDHDTHDRAEQSEEGAAGNTDGEQNDEL